MVIGEPCTVPSGSMEPTLLCGDRLWINKLAYGGRFPSRWADIPLLNVFTWIRPLRLADEENHWEYRRLPGYSEPKQGDIAVFNSPADPQLLLVKRITRVVKKGEPLRIDRRTLLLYRSLILRDGGKVMEKDGKIYIDGKSSSQYIPKQRFYYMEGDNRMNSHDSRSFGFISEEAIIGKFDFEFPRSHSTTIDFMLFFVHSANKNQSLSSLILNDTFSFFHFLNNVSNVTSSIFSAGRRFK